MKRSARCLLALAPLLLGTVAHAKDLPNINAYYATKSTKVAPSVAQAPPPAFVSSIDERRGVPTFLWAARSAATATGIGRIPGITPEAAARRHLERHASRYGLTREALATARVQQTHDIGRGGIIVVLRQAPGGVELFHNDVKVLLDRDLELVAIGGNLHAEAVAKPKSRGFVLGDTQALANALQDLYGVAVPASDFVDLKQSKADYRYYDLGSSPALKNTNLRFTDPARVKRVHFPLPDRLVPAYFLEIQAGNPAETSSDAYAYVIAADDGRVLYRENLTHHETFDYRVYADAAGEHRPTDGPMLDHCPHPTGKPDGSYPGYATPNLISIDGFNKFADPWLPSGATVTTGNNVDAYTDDDAPDGFSGGDVRATTTGANTFDRVYDPTLGPQSSSEQKMAAVTDLFYVTNWLHDWWYDSGFDEAAGNAQQNNYGRGGLAGDRMRAEAQDGAPQQRNNANMSVLSDGGSPRMQMFVWDGRASTMLGVQPLNQSLPNGVANFGPQTFDFTGDLVLANDGNGTVTDVCQPITNNVAGKVVLVDRGNCTFKQKAVNVQAAGAAGMILANNQPNDPPPALIGGNQPPGPVSIPMLSITQSDGDLLKTALVNGTVTVTMKRDPSVDRDGTIDNSVVAHEWGHYIHLRQVACGSQACGAESEGWGDFFALHLTVREGDDLHGAFPLSQYATGGFQDDPGYFGIRRYPYSVDFAKNALTFKHITDGQDLPNGVPVAVSTAQVNNAEVHAAGEVWASMLFEAYVALLDQSQQPNAPYTFAEARRRMGDYVEGGLKLAPSDPTYTEQRDAILAAAAAADPNDLQILAQAFARRGAGTCAVSPPRDSQDFSGVVESFTVQPNLAIVSVTVDDSVKSCDSDGYLDAEETGKITVTVMNTGTAPLTTATALITSKAAGATFPKGTMVSFDFIPPFATASKSIEVELAPTLIPMGTLDLKVELQGVTSCAASATLETAPMINFDELPKAAAIDTVESVDTAWTITGDGADTIWSRTEPKPGNHVWSGVDYPSPTDTALRSPTLQVSADENFVLTFDHRHSFEQSDGINWDGAVIEISTDGGAKWQDIKNFGDPHYVDVIGDPQNQAQNVLKNRDGYVGKNAGWPAMEKVTVDMGMSLAGKPVRVRFRIGTDDAAGEFGWEVDNIEFQGITNTPFTALIDDEGSCGAPPIANAGPDQTVPGGTMVTLDGSQSVDPGGLPLTYTWKQVSGTPVTLAGAGKAQPTFTAPATTKQTTLTFELQVSEGGGSSTDTVDVIVTPGGTGADAGPDAGDTLTASSGGCDCGTSGARSSGGAAAALLALAGLFARRRRARG